MTATTPESLDLTLEYNEVESKVYLAGVPKIYGVAKVPRVLATVNNKTDIVVGIKSGKIIFDHMALVLAPNVEATSSNWISILLSALEKRRNANGK